MVIPGLSFVACLLACWVARFVPVPGGHPACCHVVRPTRWQDGLGHGTAVTSLCWLAGWLGCFTKTNNGHVTGRVLCLLTDKPN